MLLSTPSPSASETVVVTLTVPVIDIEPSEKAPPPFAPAVVATVETYPA